ncbi:MAG TPA: hypothetical protein VIM16_13630 [Mucilaginibacter sp.]|jgi:hypothetical protein
MKKLFLLFSFILIVLLSKTVLAQEVADTPIVHNIGVQAPKVYKAKVLKLNKPFPITGRVLGVNLENVEGVIVTNICTAEKASTDSHGIYHIEAAKGDTLAFEIPKYSGELRSIKAQKGNLNIIMIKRKAIDLLPNHSRSDYSKARKDDDELYRILEKDAKIEGKWNY